MDYEIYFLIFTSTNGTVVRPSETNWETLKYHFFNSARGTKKTKNSLKRGEDFVFRRRDIDFWNPRQILHKKQSKQPGVFEYIFQK